MAEAPSRLWAGSVLGRRSSRNATAVLNDVILRGRVVGFPLIATDGFEYDVGVSERLFGSACVYGPVLKTRRNDRVVRVERRRRIGTAGRLKAALWESEDSETLHTSFVERLNLTIRQGSAYLRRRSPRYGLYEDLVGWHRAGQSRFVRQRRGGQIRKTMNETHMKQAVALSRKGMELGHGGPFGAVIVRDGAIVGEGWNEVLSSNDPTAHAEVVAIRNACRERGTYDLSGCEIYSSCEPCPMCLSAIYWSRIGKVYFSIGRHDAASIEFRDEFIYEELAKPFEKRALPMEHVPCDGALDVFTDWTHLAGHTTY